MMSNRIVVTGGLVLLGLVLAVGFIEILEKRFVEGDIYPYYASFRSDPLGTSAFYETVEGLPGYSVSRNLTHLNSIKGLDGETTLLLLGYPRDELGSLRAPEESPVMKAVNEGARLVVTLNPELVPERYRPLESEEEKNWFERRSELREERRQASETETADETAEEAEESEPVSGDGKESLEEEVPDDVGEDGTESVEEEIAQLFGRRLTDELQFLVAAVDAFERPENGWRTRAGKSVTADTSGLIVPRWFSQYRFETLDEAWAEVVLVKKEPVVIERRWGEGTIVIATDSFFVSNEALHREAAPEFLTWLLGGKQKLIFDETIHGTQETGGTMKLIREYRLHGVFLGLLILAVLWAWRSSSSLAPECEELEAGVDVGNTAVAGREEGEGLILLLRRSVPYSKLIDRCVFLWTESLKRQPTKKEMERIDTLRAQHREDSKRYGVVTTYREIQDTLRKR